MDYFHPQESDSHASLSLLDTMSNEERHQLDIFLNSDRHDCAMDINLIKPEHNCGLPDLDHLDSNSDYNSLQWLQPTSLANFNDENENENTDPNLLVNPVDIFTSANSTLSNLNGVDNLSTSTMAQSQTLNNIHIVTVSNPGLDISQSSNNTVRYQTVNFTTHQSVPQITKTVMSPSLSSPVLVGHLQNGLPQGRPVISLPAVQSAIEQSQEDEKKKLEKVFPKPVYSYSCLIALALKNSDSGNLPVSEIYTFMIENYPYFKTAPDGWKNSVRHNLSLNKCFQKADIPKSTSTAKKGCLWALNPAKVEKMEEEIVKWRQKDPQTLHHSMAFPEKLELIESGLAGIGNSKNSVKASSLHTPVTVKIPESSVQPSLSTPIHHPSTPNRHPSTPNHHPSTPNHLPTTPNHPSDMFMSDFSIESHFGVDTVDPALSELASGLWDDDINCDIGLDLANPPLCIATVASPMGSRNSPMPHQPTTPSVGYYDYHGTCFYASSPGQLGSPSNSQLLYATPSPRTLFA